MAFKIFAHTRLPLGRHVCFLDRQAQPRVAHLGRKRVLDAAPFIAASTVARIFIAASSYRA